MGGGLGRIGGAGPRAPGAGREDTALVRQTTWRGGDGNGITNPGYCSSLGQDSSPPAEPRAIVPRPQYPSVGRS